MDKQLLQIYYFEIVRQCDFALLAVQHLKMALTSNDTGSLTWYSLQNFLVAVGNLSKICWPVKKLSEKRGQELRKKLGVLDNVSIAPRIFRNHFEHFDERLENWAKSSKRRNFIDSNIGPQNMIVGIDTSDFLRNFDQNTWILTYRGDSYELKPIIEYLNTLRQKTNKQLSESLLNYKD